MSEQTERPSVDLTIAVHSSTRPIARAVASVLDHTRAAVRVNVVAHNIDASVICANLGAYAEHPRVRILELHDGIHSPAGPMNHGFAHSEAPFLSVMGSDDELAPGAVDSWLALQRDSSAHVVIARIVFPDGRTDPYPPVRNGRRTRDLDPLKDRLSYRSAPVGLIDRRRFGDLRFSEGLASGEDLAYSTALWFSGATIAYDLHGPGYIINDDAGDRVTAAPRAVADDFGFLDAITALGWYADASRGEREALVVKLIRLHFFDVLRAHLVRGQGVRAQAAAFLTILERLSAMATGAVRLLSIADRRVLDAIGDPEISDGVLDDLLTARWRYRTAAALLPRNPLLVMHRQAPLRTLAAGVRSSSAGA